MKYISFFLLTLFFVLIIAILLQACSTYKCYPSKRSKDYARVIKLTITSQGYMHSVADTNGERYVALYECLPDSVRVGTIVNVSNYKRLRTGGRLQVSLLPGMSRKQSNIN